MRPGTTAKDAVEMRTDPVCRALPDLVAGTALRKHFFTARGVSEFKRRCIRYDGVCCCLLYTS